MRSNCVIDVRDGSSSLLFDNWTGRGCLVDLFQLEDMMELRGILLSESCSHGQWNVGLLQEFLPPQVLVFLMSYNLHFVDEPDIVYWQSSTTGVFSLKSAYEELRSKQEDQPPYFQYLWQHEIPLKLSFFMWRLLNGLIAFPEVLRPMGFHLPSKCHIRNCQSEDSIAHCFVHCAFARSLWGYFSSRLGICFDYSGGLFSILQQCWTCADPGVCLHVVRLLPIVICWVIWCGRSASLYGNGGCQLDSSICKVIEQLSAMTIVRPISLWPSELRTISDLPFLSFKIKRRKVTVHSWQRPSQGCVKLNVDGSFINATNTAGGGMVLRDTDGHLLWAESFFFGQGSSLEAEIKALLFALRISKEQNFSDILVECDSKILVEYIRTGKNWPWRHSASLREIQELLHHTHSSIAHVFREVNSAADALAMLGTTTRSPTRFTFTSLPRHIRNVLQMDQVQFPYLRIKT